MLTTTEVFEFCQRAREAGYAITAFTPDEIEGADPRDVIDAMVAAGSEFTSDDDDDEDEDEDW